MDVNADTINYEAKWAPMEVVIALFIFDARCSMTRLCRRCFGEDGQYAPSRARSRRRTSSRPRRTSSAGSHWRTSGGCWTD